MVPPAGWKNAVSVHTNYTPVQYIYSTPLGLASCSPHFSLTLFPQCSSASSWIGIFVRYFDIDFLNTITKRLLIQPKLLSTLLHAIKVTKCSLFEIFDCNILNWTIQIRLMLLSDYISCDLHTASLRCALFLWIWSCKQQHTTLYCHSWSKEETKRFLRMQFVTYIFIHILFYNLLYWSHDIKVSWKDPIIIYSTYECSVF